MASFFKPNRKTPDGTKVPCKHYRIAYVDENGDRHTVKAYKDKAATEAMMKDIERRIERIKSGMPVEQKERTKAPIAEAIQMFLDDIARRGSEESGKHYTETKRILEAIVKQTKWSSISEIRAEKLNSYLTAMHKKGRAPRTQNRHHETIRNFVNWCVSQGWLEESPIARLQMTPVGQRGRRRRRRSYTMTEWKQLLEASGPRRVIYTVAALSGLRRSEMKRIEKRDLKPMKWTIRGEITKNGKSENLPMLQECWDAIKDRWQKAKSPTTKLFPDVPVHETVRSDITKAGIQRQDEEGRWVDFHSLRYFFCTILARKLPIQLVRLLMRHRDIRMTCNLYMDLGIDDMASLADRLPTILQHEDAPDQHKKHDNGGKSISCADTEMTAKKGANAQNE